jgi:uncharacterized protein YprB with RNaseH-like and TPR domain
MFTEKQIANFLFFDIETCGKFPNYETFCQKDPHGADIWKKKWSLYLKRDGMTLEESYLDRVSIYPEFGKIVCLSYGVLKNGEMTIKTIAEENETDMMKLIYQLFAHAGNKGMRPTGWNIKQFDIPWIQRKLMMVGISIPDIIDTNEKKPWEVSTFDLKQLWRGFSTFDCTFEEATYAMNVPSPKDDIDGSQVHTQYWAGNVDRIKAYCEKDVVAMMQLIQKI